MFQVCCNTVEQSVICDLEVHNCCCPQLKTTIFLFLLFQSEYIMYLGVLLHLYKDDLRTIMVYEVPQSYLLYVIYYLYKTLVDGSSELSPVRFLGLNTFIFGLH